MAFTAIQRGFNGSSIASISWVLNGYTIVFFSMLGPPPRSTLFPYTTLFRSTPDPRPRRQPRHDPQTRRRPGPATGPPRHRYQPAPLAHEVKSHVRRPDLGH